ncbi:MAG: hypothetical protein R3F19_16470 [Verrucomicrobiales bacterium]
MKELSIYSSLALLAILAGWTFASNLARETATESNPIDASSIGSVPFSPIAPSKNERIPNAVREISRQTGNLDFTSLADFYQRLAVADAGDCRRWLDSLGDASSDDAITLTKAIFEHWSHLDQASAIAALRESTALDEHDFKSDLLERMFGRWARDDMTAALDMALVGTNSTDVYGVVWAVDQSQVEALYELLIQRGFNRTSPGSFQVIYSRLAEVDVERAASLALQNNASTGFENVINQWVSNDSGAVLQWAESLTSPVKRQQALDRLACEWLEIRPLEGMKAMWDKVDFTDLERFALSTPLGSRASEGEYEQMLAFIESKSQQSPIQAAHLLQAIVNGMRYSDHPERLGDVASVFAIVTGNQEIELAHLARSVGEVTTRWLMKDEDSLIAFINDVPSDQIRDAAIDSLYNHWCSTDPTRAIALANQFERPEWSAGLVETLIEMCKTPDEVLELLPENSRQDAMPRITSMFANSNPEESFALAAQQPAGAARDKMMLEVLSAWSRFDPEKAVEKLPQMTSMPEAERRLFANVWSQGDLNEARALAESVSELPYKSQALAPVLNRSIETDPEWTARMAGRTGEVYQLENALEIMAHRDADAAIAWIESHPDLNVPKGNVEKIRSAIKEEKALREFAP